MNKTKLERLKLLEEYFEAINNSYIVFQEKPCDCDDEECEGYYYICIINDDQLPYKYGNPADAVPDIFAYFELETDVTFINGDESWN